MGGKDRGAPLDRYKLVSARLTPRGLAFVRGCLSHLAATTGVAPYLYLSSAVLGTELALTMGLQNE